ncbi:hypothetical protein E4U43_001923, partial [Claviceps pusilla]
MPRLKVAVPQALAFLLLVAASICGASEDASPTPAMTTAPVFIPYYSEDQWSAMRGSIIAVVGLDMAGTRMTIDEDDGGGGKLGRRFGSIGCFQRTAPTGFPTKLPTRIEAATFFASRATCLDSEWTLMPNKTASETTFTIFCPTATQVACDLSLEFPFIIVEGPSTLKFHGTLTST